MGVEKCPRISRVSQAGLTDPPARSSIAAPFSYPDVMNSFPSQ
jgi:hypothetical protein